MTEFLAMMMQMDLEPIDLDLLQRHPEVSVFFFI
jgi:hypothetical protein